MITTGSNGIPAGDSNAGGDHNRPAVAAAPSLPRLGPVSAGPSETAGPADAGRPVSGPPSDDAIAGGAAVGLAGLSHLLAGRLADARAMAADARDRVACAQALRYATDVCSLLGGAAGR
jgi:hypothetical protein